MRRNDPSVIIRIILFMAAAGFLIVAMFGGVEGNWPLSGCLICVVLGNVINLKHFKMMQQQAKREQAKKKK